MKDTLPQYVAGPQLTTRLRDSYWPLVISLSVLAALCMLDAILTIKLCDGHFVYPLDDTYIGAAMAKNFALYGVWGVTRRAFTSASSCPLWVLLLAGAYRVFGVSQYTPLALSLIFSFLALFAADRLLLKSLPTRTRTLALVAIVLFTPLHVLGLIGMEHSLHVLLTLVFLRLSADLLAEHRWSSWLWALVPSMVMVRYESMFLIAPVVVLLVFQKRWRWAILMSSLAWLPVIAYGAISLSKGWYWLPNSIAMKGASGHRFFLRLLATSFGGPDLVAVLVALPITAYLVRSNRRVSLMLWTVFIAGCLHLSMANVGWVYRYEDYLLAAAVAASAVAFPTLQKAVRREPALALVLLVPTAILAGRSALATVQLPKYSHAVYLQQYQMAKFIHRYYDGSSIAANDIGAINFFNDLICVDLVGLANRDIFFAKRSNSYTTSVINSETRTAHISIAIVYDSWFSVKPTRFGGPPLPRQWKRIARWKVPKTEGLGSDIVSFYAVKPEQAARLGRSLRNFSRSLPHGVEVIRN